MKLFRKCLNLKNILRDTLLFFTFYKRENVILILFIFYRVLQIASFLNCVYLMTFSSLLWVIDMVWWWWGLGLPYWSA